VCAPAAHGQKPALVQNIDEKGRNPYQQTIQFTPTSPTAAASCSSGSCTVSFKTVPAGYRLVVTQVTAAFAAASTGDAERLAVLASITSTTPQTSVDIAVLPTPTLSGGIQTLNAAVTFYVEPGLIPYMLLSNVLSTGSEVTVSITGYLVNLNE
jgi:hypothetical protein